MRREHFDIGKDVSNPNLSAAATQYAGNMGLVRPNRIQHALVNYAQAKEIAQDYESAPSFDKEAVPSFKAFGEETERQFDFLTKPKAQGGLGIHVEVSESDPYKRARDMMEDIRHNARLRVLSTATTGGHPYLTNDQNDMFRAVHDAFGHAAVGRGFDPHGEEAAYRSHSTMFSPLARGAMSTETRGQNSALNFGSEPGKFVEQKVALLNPSSRLILPIGRRSAFREQAMLDAKKAHIKAFGE